MGNKTNNTRQKLIESAIDVFAENGFNEGGVREITERAGVVRPSLYHYFGSRDGLWKEIYQYLFHDYIAFVEKTYTPTNELEKNILMMLKVQQKFNSKYPKKFRVLFQSALSRPGKEVNEVYNQIHPLFNEMMERIFDTSGVKPSMEVTSLLFAFLENNALSLAMRRKSNKGAVSPEEIAVFLAQMIKQAGSAGSNGRKVNSSNGKKVVRSGSVRSVRGQVAQSARR